MHTILKTSNFIQVVGILKYNRNDDDDDDYSGSKANNTCPLKKE